MTTWKKDSKCLPFHINIAKHVAATHDPHVILVPRRQRLRHVVASKPFGLFVLTLVLLDVLFVFTALLLELFYPEYEFAVVQCTNPDASKQLLSSSSEHESIPLSTVCATLYNNNNSSLVELTTTCSIQEVIGRPESVETAISALEYMSVGILSVMLLEIGFTVAVVGRAWVTVLHLLDLAVVLASLVLEIVLKAQPQLRQTLSLLIIVRMWTVVRLFEGIQEANEMAHAAEQEKQREELVRLRAEVERLRGDDNHLV